MPSEDPRAQLLRDHSDIEGQLIALVDAFELGDRTRASEAFAAFDRRLSAHLAFEEEVLLPLLMSVDRHAADRIAAEHRIIRAALEALAIADNLHLSRASEVHRFVDILRSHARNEERTLYTLADRLGEIPELRTRLGWLRAATSTKTSAA